MAHHAKKKILFFWHQGSWVSKWSPTLSQMSFCAAHNLKNYPWKICSGSLRPLRLHAIGIVSVC